LIEFALILPVLFVMIVNTVNFGGFIFAWITVSGAARTGANYWIQGRATTAGNDQPTSAQVSAVVTQEISSLLNRDSLSVTVCKKFNTTTDCSGSPPSDPEATHYAIGVVDVTYTYKPLIPSFNFRPLGVSAGFFPSAGVTVHREAAMRILN
jgi:Flp pilus assembly protein TadG